MLTWKGALMPMRELRNNAALLQSKCWQHPGTYAIRRLHAEARGAGW